MTQRKTTETLKKIPETDRKKLQLEEERKRKIELKYIKENMWKKWRTIYSKNEEQAGL